MQEDDEIHERTIGRVEMPGRRATRRARRRTRAPRKGGRLATVRWLAICGGLGLGLAVGPGGCGPADGGGGGSEASRDPAASGGTTVTDAGFAQALDAAEQRLDTGDRAAAETILATAVRRRPDDPRARELLGRVSMGRAAEAAQQGAAPERIRRIHAEAWSHYRLAVAGRPDDAGLHSSAGLVALAAGEEDEALRLFAEATRLDGTLPQPRLFAGQIHLQREDHAAAARAFEAVLALDPSEPYALSSLAMVRLAEDRQAEAIRLAGEARSIAPDDPALRVQEIRVLRLAGSADAAIARMLAMPPGDLVAMGLTPELAAAYRTQGRLEAAAGAWERAWEMRPPGPARAAAALGAATAWADAGEIETAWSWLARARGNAAADDAAAIADLEERLRPGGAAGGATP